MNSRFLSLLLLFPGSLSAAAVVEKGAMAQQRIEGARFRFGGPAGQRIEANIDGWLLPAPAANPGLLEMFRLRDRLPVPELVPWAGEFAGKYLLSCVQALRMTDRPDLQAHTAAFVAALTGTQAEDGYLGPFPKARRLLGEWDLWGHYHVMQGLLQWSDFAGDRAAFAAAVKAADLICRIYQGGSRRVFDAGSPEMNMAVSHVLAELHRRTGEPRYLEMVREIEKDWERAGDYVRTGVQGIPFYRTPLPRWESLHDLQALVELWRITGEARYREAFISHWRTIRAFDVRNSGAFSGGEQATGNAYAPTAIETCCTVAWMALSIDMLALTGDPRVADDLELSTFNGGLGAQHPSGRWWTYNTPMDGDRKASTHDIVFQARAGTPELNCCSVNGPRVPGMLSEWAVMQCGAGLTVNWHGACTVTLPGQGGRLVCETGYPRDGRITWRVESAGSRAIRFRIPAWAAGATAIVAGQPVPVTPGSYLETARDWQAGDTVTLQFPLPLRPVAGALDQEGRLSLYRGPLLLAWDQADNAGDEGSIPRLDPALFGAAREVAVTGTAPWLLMEVPVSGQSLRLRDFASAGSRGTRYRSWLRTAAAPRDPGAEGLALRAPLRGTAEAVPGRLARATAFTPAGDAVSLNGKDQMLSYVLPESFAEAATVSVHVRIRELPPAKQLGQVFSAWAGPGDDPLRIVVQDGKVFARTEPGSAAGAGGVPLRQGAWHHLAAVRAAGSLSLWVDGEPAGSVALAAAPPGRSRLAALGGNPLFTGQPEFLAADFAALTVYTRALSGPEIAGLAARR